MDIHNLDVQGFIGEYIDGIINKTENAIDIKREKMN